MTALVATTSLETPVHACATLSPEGLRKFERYKSRFLAEESDKRITGTFHLEWEYLDEQENYQARVGYVEVETRRGVHRYQLFIPDEINCGFPNYDVQDGRRGTFYLKKDEDPDPDDLEDGVIDNFAFVHFEPRD
ncbi:hypothetical protein [Porphyrobacter sp. ULC335]|uniref:hypothetical protein n=1 Tax=Porphyrobacter sp. ULC335 TaxID=2854260 RepID=UPI00221FD523|nr:hypothetical protein [Porphyrobacter sp. ULC335]UYV14578.1 hypothetical protein KVF90_10450 [Porphyrobacter sp. ULC335]